MVPEVDTEAIIDSMPIQLKRFVNANMKFIKNEEDIVETGRDIGALKKTANAVSKEVSEGSRGFLTYYDSAMKAKASNDEVGFEGNVAKMESFLKSQKDKLGTFKRVEQNIINEYITMAEQSGKTLKQVYNDVKNNNDTMSYTYGDKNKPAKVKKNTVLEKYLYHKDDNGFNGGVYKYMNMVQNEVAAMDRLTKKLTKVTPVVSTEDVNEAPMAKSGIEISNLAPRALFLTVIEPFI